MFGNLRTQLLLSSIAALALLLMGIWASTHGLMAWATAIYIAVCVFVLAINVWFWFCVARPLEKAAGFCKAHLLRQLRPQDRGV